MYVVCKKFAHVYDVDFSKKNTFIDLFCKFEKKFDTVLLMGAFILLLPYTRRPYEAAF